MEEQEDLDLLDKVELAADVVRGVAFALVLIVLSF